MFVKVLFISAALWTISGSVEARWWGLLSPTRPPIPAPLIEEVVEMSEKCKQLVDGKEHSECQIQLAKNIWAIVHGGWLNIKDCRLRSVSWFYGTQLSCRLGKGRDSKEVLVQREALDSTEYQSREDDSDVGKNIGTHTLII